MRELLYNVSVQAKALLLKPVCCYTTQKPLKERAMSKTNIRSLVTAKNMAIILMVGATLLLVYQFGTTSHVVSVILALVVIGGFYRWATSPVENNLHPCPHGCGQKGRLRTQVPVGTPEVGQQRYRLEYHCLCCGPFHLETMIEMNPTTN
jgi:hypothetical protein